MRAAVYSGGGKEAQTANLATTVSLPLPVLACFTCRRRRHHHHSPPPVHAGPETKPGCRTLQGKKGLHSAAAAARRGLSLSLSLILHDNRKKIGRERHGRICQQSQRLVEEF